MKQSIFFIGITASWILTGCSAVLYTPTSQMTPLHEKKGDIELTGSYGFQGAEASASVAVSDHLAVAAQGRIGTKESDPLHQLTGGQHDGKRSDKFTYGAALTYFNAPPQEDALYWSVAAGFANGQSQSIYTKNGLDGPSTSDISSTNTQVYVQPLIAFRQEYMDAIFSCRTGWVGINNIDTDATDFTDKKIDMIVAQPAATVRIGPKHVKGYFQVGYTLANKKNYDDITTFFGGRLGSSIGVQATF